MAVELSVGTPLAEALNSAVHTKLLEVGWGSEDDTSLAEFIVLMLVNGKTEDQIALELASDILPEGEGTQEFARWLFERVRILQGGGASPAEVLSEQQSIPSFPDSDEARNSNESQQSIPVAYNSDMIDGPSAAPGNAPTGPKNFRAGSTPNRGSRIVGQLNRAMDRSNESVLHRVRQGSGSERINSHVRDAPKWPKGIQNRPVRPGMQKALEGIGMPVNPMANSMTPQGPMPMPLSPQQQMEMMAMMEQSARMMAQLVPGMVAPTMNSNANSNFQQNGGQQGKSLFDRVEAKPGKRGRGGRTQQNGSSRMNSITGGNSRDSAMDTAEKQQDNAPSSSMEVEPSSQQQPADPSTTMCRWNLKCSNKTCAYVHQSPAAPEGTTVDMADSCSFGVACKNPKCTGRHPSPAQIKIHQSNEQCKFYPYCQNPSCPFKHPPPSMPMCRNGADCTIPHCKFTHLQTLCKFNPCKNVRCPYKHAEGQRASYTDKVWTAESTRKEDKDHVSERKFVEEDGEEELVKPADVAAQAAELIT